MSERIWWSGFLAGLVVGFAGFPALRALGIYL